MSETTRRKKTSIKTVNAIIDQFWVIEQGTDRPKGLIALDFLYRDDPEAFLRFVGQYLPREIVIENTLAEIDDDAIEDMIFRIREKVEHERKAIEARRQLEFAGTGSCIEQARGGEIAPIDGEAGEGGNDLPCDRG